MIHSDRVYDNFCMNHGCKRMTIYCFIIFCMNCGFKWVYIIDTIDIKLIYNSYKIGMNHFFTMINSKKKSYQNNQYINEIKSVRTIFYND